MKKTRYLAVLLITLVFIAVFSVPAIAATPVCKIGNKGYDSLNVAVNVVKTGQTIKVTRNIKTKEGIDVHGNAKKFTIDFNNKSYIYTGNEFAFGVAPGHTVIIKHLNLSASGAFTIGGTLILENGKMTSGYISVNDDGNTKGTLNIKGGTYQIKKENDRGPWIDNKGTVNISKGTFKGVADLRNFGTITIKGGKFNYSGGHDLLSNMGKAVITGGTFKCKGIAVKSEGNGANTTISGGTFSRAEDGGPVVDLAGTAKISKGTFNGGLRFLGKATITGGKSTHRIGAQKGSDVTINNFTVNQGNQPPQGPGHGNPTLLAEGGKITVNGGTYISKNGYGYAAYDGGQVIFGVKDYQKLFKVKQLKYD